MIRKFVIALWSLLWLVCAQANPGRISTVTLNAWDLGDAAAVAKKLKHGGFNHVTLYVPWFEVEPREGTFDFAKFDGWIAPLAKEGIKFILIIDFGGRPFFDDAGRKTERSVIPDWFIQRHGDALMRNFSSQPTRQINFLDADARKLTSRLVDNSVRHFSRMYGEAISGFAIGLQEEHEIKYGQEGYQWRDYGRQFVEQYRNKFNTAPPVINYNNEIAQANVRRESHLMDLLKLRDEHLMDAMCHYAAIVREYRHAVVAYFGEIFTSHDAIYGGGIVEKLSPCVDIAVVDFNFYDGYQLQPNVDILPLMANYLAHNGYKKIMIGAYAEQWANQGRKIELLPYINQSLERAASNPNVIGFEIGGFYKTTQNNQVQSLDFEQLGRIEMNSPATKAAAASMRIGLLASQVNFNFWHGERSNGRNVHQDALERAYGLLAAMPDVEVVVLGDRALLEDRALVQSLDAIFVPHQIVLQHATKQRLRDFWARGGVLIQDMRLGEFSPDGAATGDWLHDVFGIAEIRWSQGPGRFVYMGERVGLDMRGKTYVNHALLKPRPGYSVHAKSLGSKRDEWLSWLKSHLLGREGATQDAAYGVVLSGERSLVFGFLPQLVEGPEATIWRRVFVDEVAAAVARGVRSKSRLH